MTKSKFDFSFKREVSWQDGYRTAMKDAIAWLHKRAEEFNDETAKHTVNSAATNLGWAFKEREASQNFTFAQLKE